MRTIAYGLFLVLLIIGGVVLLRSIKPSQEAPPAPTLRFPGAVAPDVTTLDMKHVDAARPDELCSMGNEFLQMWRVREATVVFERAVAEDSTCYPAWRKLIDCYANPLIDDEDGLDSAISHALATAPGDTSLVAGLRLLYVDRDYAGALKLFAAAAHHHDETNDALYYAALADYRMGRLGDAARQLAPLVKRDDTVGPVVELAIRRAVAARDLDHAVDAARGLGRTYTEEPFPYVLIAQVEMARGDRKSAVEFCNNALVLDPRCIPAIMTRALLYADAGDYEAARVSFQKLMLFDPLVLRSIGQEGIGFVDFLAGEFDDGVAAMDEAIREAMVAGATRRGLAISLRLVEYLCQLGQADAAENVVDRWVTGFGDVPVRLSRARIQVLRGDFRSASTVIDSLAKDPVWGTWARAMDLDVPELRALVDVGQQRQTDALALLNAPAGQAVGGGAQARRLFLRGYAAFESGDAENASTSFRAARSRLIGPEFPYHGDPVVYVQSLFFMAEADVARGDQADAMKNYQAFLGYWGDASWDLEAVARARKKLEALGGVTTPPQG